MLQLDRILESAESAFFDTLALSVPEARTGDISPETLDSLQREMRAAAIEWIRENAPVTYRTMEVNQ